MPKQMKTDQLENALRSLPSKATSTVFQLELGGGRWWSSTLARKQTTTSTVLKISSEKKKYEQQFTKIKMLRPAFPVHFDSPVSMCLSIWGAK